MSPLELLGACPHTRPHFACQAGWTADDGAIFTALWGDGPGSRACAVRGQSLLVANKTDLGATLRLLGCIMRINAPKSFHHHSPSHAS